jgi:CRISPR-associated endonuclease Csy4
MSSVSHYVELRLQPDPEFPAAMLMAALYAKLHRALVAAAQGEEGAIGVSFPAYRLQPREMGVVMRLHGSERALSELMASSWLRGIRDHLADDAPAVQAVPAEVLGYRAVRRVQADSNPERLRRRLIRHKNVTPEEAERRIPQESGQRLSLPFVSLTSSSTGHPFYLFIAHDRVQKTAQAGHFNTYGLSQNGTTIPWF